MDDGMKFEGGMRDCKGPAVGGRFAVLMEGKGNYSFFCAENGMLEG